MGQSQAQKDYAYDLETPYAKKIPDDISCTSKAPARYVFRRKPFCEGEEVLERDVRTSTSYWFKEAKLASLASVSNTLEASDDLASNSRALAVNVFDGAIPDRLRKDVTEDTGLSHTFDLPDCGFFDIGCQMKRMILKALDRSYVSKRRELRTDFVERVVKEAGETNDDIQQVGDVARANIDVTFSRLEHETFRQTWIAFRSADVFSSISRLLAVIAILKSFGFMLGRVAFSDPRLNRQFSMGQVKSAGPEIDEVMISNDTGLKLAKAGRYRVIAGSDVDGISPSGFRPVQAHRQTLKRLIPLRHVFQSFNCVPDQADIVLPCGNVERIIAIPLEPGQKMGYFPQYLHGFSGSPTLSSHWSFRIGHLLQGRMRICLIHGPCTIILKSSQGPSVLNSKRTKTDTELKDTRSDGISPARLMAWTDGLDLDVKCEPGVVAAYTASIRVKPYGDGIAVFDGPRGRNRFGGALTFIPALFLPI